MKLKKCKTKISYCVEIEPEQMLQISNKEKASGESELYDQLLEVTGLTYCHYHPNFGSYIHFNLEPQYDTKATWKEIERIINKAIAV